MHGCLFCYQKMNDSLCQTSELKAYFYSYFLTDNSNKSATLKTTISETNFSLYFTSKGSSFV